MIEQKQRRERERESVVSECVVASYYVCLAPPLLSLLFSSIICRLPELLFIDTLHESITSMKCKLSALESEGKAKSNTDEEEGHDDDLSLSPTPPTRRRWLSFVGEVQEQPVLISSVLSRVDEHLTRAAALEAKLSELDDSKRRGERESKAERGRGRGRCIFVFTDYLLCCRVSAGGVEFD